MRDIEFGLMKLWKFEEIVHFAKVDPEDLVLYIEVINKTKKQKYFVELDPIPRIDYDYVMDYPPIKIEYPEKNKKMIIPICSDKHIGSEWESLRYIRKIYRELEKKGAKFVLDCGDLLDPLDLPTPEEPDSKLEGFGEIIGRLIRKHPKNIPTYFITGNNESKLFWQRAISPGHIISRARKDLICLDDTMFASVKIRNLTINLSHGLREKRRLSVVDYKQWHPYILINKPNIVCHGHFHKGEIKQVSDDTLLCVVPSMIKGEPTRSFMGNDRGIIILTVEEKEDGFVVESELILDNSFPREVEKKEYFLVKKK